MNYSLFDFLNLLGALGFFIYGMKVMSEGIQKVAGEKLRDIMSAMTSNRFLGVFTGLLITSLVQSSSATTVMTVSFVNAGLLSLGESISVIMGANIGTTVTGWLISIFGFKVKISSVTLPIIAVGLPLMFSNKSNLKSWSEVLIGFSLLFMGLDALKSSVPDLKGNPQVLQFLANYADLGFLSLVISILIGTVLTIVVQSSSAAMALTLVLLNQEVITLEMAAGIVMGENIGTTITANLAAIVANTQAKRSARAHFIFNVFGVAWMLLAFPFFMRFIESIMPFFRTLMQDDSPTELALALFHTSFNIVNTFLLIWFIPLLEKIVNKMVIPKTEEEKYHLEYISGSMMGTSELSVLEAKKEVAKFGQLIERMHNLVEKMVNERDSKAVNHLNEKIGYYEEITDKIEIEIADYLLKISEGEMSEKTSLRVRSMLGIVGDLERIGDVYYQISKTYERKQKEKAWFTPDQREHLNSMMGELKEALKVMNQNLDANYDNVSLEKADEVEKLINKLRNKLRKVHLKSMENRDYNMKSGIYYTDLFNSFEKIGDHVVNVTEAITGRI